MVPGSRVGPYEILAPLGAGGMGEVYRAHDTRLGRQVAIKMISAEFSANKDRLERFEREARSASALNHPNIITVYDIGTNAGATYIAMELVEGKSLREMLEGGLIPLRKAVNIAAQLADGLAKAHSAGIVHRDLKPENLMISKDGFLKILDFGLAKSDLFSTEKNSMLATIAKTGEGVILGTVGYMSPEQAAAKSVDFRSDQFTFGAILYEMVTGKRPFVRNTPVQSLSAIIQEDPEPIGTLSPQTPAPIRWIVERCLAKEPEDRYASTRDLARELQSVRDHFSDLGSSTEITSAQPSLPKAHPIFFGRLLARWMTIFPWILVAVLGTVLAILMIRLQTKSDSPISRNLEISIPRGYQLEPNASPAISPDGSAIVFGLLDSKLMLQLWLRRLDQFESIPLPGTQGAIHPFWSPDSKEIAFFAKEGIVTTPIVIQQLVLKRYDIASGSIQVICQAGGLSRGGAWLDDGTILFTPSVNSPIQRVPATGGQPQDVTKLDPAILDGSHRFPALLPDGQHFLFTLWSNHLETATKVGGIYLGSLEKSLVRKLTSDESQAVVAGPDRILTYRNGALVSLSLDPKTLEVTGSAEEISKHPLFNLSSGTLAVTASKEGDVAFALASGEGSAQLSWLDRTGADSGMAGRDRVQNVTEISVAPDGNRFGATVLSPNGSEIWIGNAQRQMFSRLAGGGVDVREPVWSSDGASIAFASYFAGAWSVFVQPADGSRQPEVLITDPSREILPSSWSSDGKFIIVNSYLKSGSGRIEIWFYDIATKKCVPILTDSAASLSEGALSPDGKWLAYISDESGGKEVYVRPYPSLDRKWQLSQNSVVESLHWRNDGREIVFQASDRSLNSVKIETQNGGFEAGTAQLLFTPRLPIMAAGFTPDHTRILAAIVPGDVVSEPIRIILGRNKKSN